MRKRQHDAETDEAPWISFSDALAALVFVFMILTAAFLLAARDAEAKAKQRQDELNGQMRPYTQSTDERRAIIEKLALDAEACLPKNLPAAVSVDGDPEAGRISLFLPGKGWFDTGKATLANDDAAVGPVVESAIGALRVCLQETLSKPSETFRIRVSFEGHTDGRNIARGGEFPTNWELSAARGAALLRSFRCISQPGHCTPPELPRVELVASGYADSVVAPLVLCEQRGTSLLPREGVSPSGMVEYDGRVCTWLQKHRTEQFPSEQAARELSSAVDAFLAGAPGAAIGASFSDRTVEESLRDWALAWSLCREVNDTAQPHHACAQRWSRLRRVDVRIEVSPPSTSDVDEAGGTDVGAR